VRVAILGQFPFDVSRLGGVEVAIAYLLDAFVQSPGMVVDIVTCRTEARRPETHLVQGVRVHYLPRQNLGRLTWHLREVALIRRCLGILQPDIVHAHGTGLYAGAALASPYPSVITVHGIVAREVRLYRGLGLRSRGAFDALYERWCLHRARHLIAISPYVRRELAKATRAQWYDVENAVDEAFFRIEGPGEPGRILFAGAVIARKGLHILADAMAQVQRYDPGATVVVAGATTSDPLYATALHCEIAQQGVEGSFQFIGQQDQEHLVHEYQRCSIFVLPSLQETAPMAVQQAMAAGRAVVATAVGGIPDMITHGETGLLVPPQDSRALAEALLTLLSNDSMRTDLGQAGRAQAEERFMPARVAQRTRDVYQRVIAAVRGAPCA